MKTYVSQIRNIQVVDIGARGVYTCPAEHYCKEAPMIDVTTAGDVTVIKPGQDIVSTMVPQLKAQVADLLANNHGKLCLDLQGVEMMDSVGIGVLIAVHNSLKKQGHKLIVSNASENIMKLFRTMRLDQHFQMDK